jgi:hypothetical protein
LILFPVKTERGMLDECPHCYRKVLLREDGSCPACGKLSTDTSEVDPTRTLLTIRRGSRFPEICFNCAEPATHRILARAATVSRAQEAATWTWTLALANILPFLGAIFLLARSRDIRKDIVISIDLPICKKCRRLGIKPEIESYDLHEREMRVVVSRTFASAVTGKTA